MTENWKYLDAYLRLRLADLEPRMFEEFFLHFLRAGISLTIKRNGQTLTKKVLSAELYAAGSGRNQKGIDLRVEVEDGEIWGFQCKRCHKWTPVETRDAIEKASQFPAQHYFLVVACDPHEGVQDEMAKHPDWTFWNLSTICTEFRLRVPASKQPQVLYFLPPQELKRFIPYATESLIPPDKYFGQFPGADKLFRHDWKLVGRKEEMKALQDFLSGTSVVQIVSARGGEGKSRLLWEMCSTLPQELSQAEVLFLNPHRSDDEFAFAFLENPAIRVIVVDDAHRTEQVPLKLLALVTEDAKKRRSKIVFATRPQGVEALFHKLYETGLWDKCAPQIALGQLKKSQTKALAAEALGASLADYADELAGITADSPFLTVIAGGLLRLDRLKWGKWASDEDFRRHVFREFEYLNLDSIPESDRKVSKGLLRLLALLAPVPIGQKLAEAGAKCLGCSVFEFESLLARLRQSELVAGHDDGLRIVPDLFADFLVYDACYEPKQKMPGFVGQVLKEFIDCSPALLRNLSEATWIARANQISDDDLLQPLVKQEYQRFESSDFYTRHTILQHWSNFSVYLPRESLDLARLAVGLKTASADLGDVQGPIRIPELIDIYGCDQLATLLKSIAKYHPDKYGHEALGFLWALGLARNWERNEHHPWAAIAEVIKFEPQKPIQITLDALDWLKTQLQSPSALKTFETKTAVLSLLLGPCFSRVVEWSWWEGRTCHFCKQAVSFENTQPIRDRAFAILEWIIGNGSWVAALDVLSALAGAIQRILLPEFQKEEEIPKLTETWRPERLKALALYEKIVAKHRHIAVRYEIRQTLKRDLAYEEDTAFAKEARLVLAGIPNDLALQTAVALMSNGIYEFEEEMKVPRTPEEHKKFEALWSERVRRTAAALALNFPTAQELYEFLRQITGDLAQAAYHPVPITLFTGLGEAAPDLALSLAKEIISAGVETPLSHAWPALFDKNSAAGETKQIELYHTAAKTAAPSVSSAVIRALAWKARQIHPLSDAEKKLLLEIAEMATQEATLELLGMVAWCSDANMALAIQILKKLPIGRFGHQMLEHVLEALAPYQECKTPIPPAVVRLVLMQLVDVPDLEMREARQWEVLIEQHPRLVFDLLLARMERATAKDSAESFRPVPFCFWGRLSLPGLAKEPDYPEICRQIWEHALSLDDPQQHYWMRLFQAVVLDNTSFWLARMLQEIETTPSVDILERLAELFKFDGSLVIFRIPDLARAFLDRARHLGGKDGHEKMQVSLYHGCGPQGRAYTNGTLNQNLDYVEAEAVKAAEAHAKDEILGPFYRWIVEVEQNSRRMHKMPNEMVMAAAD